MLLHDFLAVRTAKYAMCSEHTIEDSTQRINICICIGRLTQQLLWRWSTGYTIAIEQISLRFWSAQFEHAHDAKVCHNQIAIGPDENTIGCKVAMEHSFLVRILQSCGYLIQVTAGQDYIYRAFLRKHCAQRYRG